MKLGIADVSQASVTTVNRIPKQSAAMQRARGVGNLAVNLKAGLTRVESLFEEGAAKIRFPGPIEGSGLEAVLINTAGGMTGGDSFSWNIAAGANTNLTLTTQACEKIYKSAGGEAAIDVRLKAESGATLQWLPQETIVFDRSRLRRTIEADLAAGAIFLCLEAVVFGRGAMGETVNDCRFADRWRIRVDGKLVHAEDMRIDGDAHALLARRATGNGAAAFAAVLLVTPNAADLLDLARRAISGLASAGASAWRLQNSGKLLARLAARDGYELRQSLAGLIGVLNNEAALPKVWSI